MKIIELTKGYSALVDDDDFEVVSKHKWYADVSTDGLRVYARTDLPGKIRIRLHRFIMKARPGELIDHINGNKSTLDCRRKNLRVSNKSKNGLNAKISSKNTSGYSGVHFHPQTGKWRASVVHKGKRLSLGLFEKPNQASIVVESKRLELLS